MKMLISLLLITGLFIHRHKTPIGTTLKAPYPPIDWQSTKHWKLYNIKSKDAFRYPLDTLHVFKSILLDQDSMMHFLKQVTELPQGQNPLWMGAYVASCQLPNGDSVKMEISQYGSFFYEEKERRYFQLSEDIGDHWPAYWTSKWLELIHPN
jgi:hypothetical protein